ncbi:hypothetical protein [Zobellella taiwanensis]
MDFIKKFTLYQIMPYAGACRTRKRQNILLIRRQQHISRCFSAGNQWYKPLLSLGNRHHESNSDLFLLMASGGL